MTISTTQTRFSSQNFRIRFCLWANKKFGVASPVFTDLNMQPIEAARKNSHKKIKEKARKETGNKNGHVPSKFDSL
jgi:hypothetical protein